MKLKLGFVKRSQNLIRIIDIYKSVKNNIFFLFQSKITLYIYISLKQINSIDLVVVILFDIVYITKNIIIFDI